MLQRTSDVVRCTLMLRITASDRSEVLFASTRPPPSLQGASAAEFSGEGSAASALHWPS
jgi:hypothetical protein